MCTETRSKNLVTCKICCQLHTLMINLFWWNLNFSWFHWGVGGCITIILQSWWLLLRHKSKTSSFLVQICHRLGQIKVFDETQYEFPAESHTNLSMWSGVVYTHTTTNRWCSEGDGNRNWGILDCLSIKVSLSSGIHPSLFYTGCFQFSQNAPCTNFIA